MRIAIYGSSSPIGSFLENKLRASGFSVTTFSRKNPLGTFDLQNFSFNDFSSFDYVIHLAHAHNASAEQFATILLQHEILLKEYRGRFIFISSMSANIKNPSMYSVQKQSLEEMFSRYGHPSLRLGLVVNLKDGKEQNQPARRIATLLKFAPYFHSLPNLDARFYITTFEDIQNITLEILRKIPTFLIKDVFSIGPLEINQLNLALGGENRQFGNSLFVHKLIFSLIAKTKIGDRFLNFTHGMFIHNCS